MSEEKSVYRRIKNRSLSSEQDRVALIEEYRSFVEENGRLPKAAPKGSIEARLAGSIAHALRKGIFTEEERSAVDEIKRVAKKSRDWSSEQDRAVLIEECRLFVEENGRFPGYSASSGPRERHLASTVGSGLSKGLFTEEERAVLDKMKQVGRKRRNWRSEQDRVALIEECRLFVEENGRFPSESAPAGSRECHLAKSVANGLNWAFTAEERAALKEMKRGTRDRPRDWSDEQDRAALIEECRLFVKERGWFPKAAAMSGPRERYLAVSVSSGLKKGLFTEEERATLRQMGREYTPRGPRGGAH